MQAIRRLQKPGPLRAATSRRLFDVNRTMSAIGGVYVPVNDAAVTLNTGSSCIRMRLTRSRDAERMSATAAMNRSRESSRNGNGAEALRKVLSKIK